MRTIVYIDGFNLYYGCLRRTPFKWLDVRKLCELLLPKNDILQIKYFTARVSAREDPQQPFRQQTYLRALQTLSNVEIHYPPLSVRTPVDSRAPQTKKANRLFLQGKIDPTTSYR